jgi:hypothetical protein
LALVNRDSHRRAKARGVAHDGATSDLANLAQRNIRQASERLTASVQRIIAMHRLLLHFGVNGAAPQRKSRPGESIFDRKAPKQANGRRLLCSIRALAVALI